MRKKRVKEGLKFYCIRKWDKSSLKRARGILFKGNVHEEL